MLPLDLDVQAVSSPPESPQALSEGMTQIERELLDFMTDKPPSPLADFISEDISFHRRRALTSSCDQDVYDLHLVASHYSRQF